MMRKPQLALLATTVLVVAACSKNDRDTPAPPPMANAAPQISAIGNKIENQDTAIVVDFGVQDDGTPANMLVVTAAADATSLFPTDGLVLSGDGTTRTLTLRPLESATGTANLTITAADAQGVKASRAFSVTVNARGASMRDVTLTTFAKGETSEATAVNGFTFADDANDPAIFDPLVTAP